MRRSSVSENVATHRLPLLSNSIPSGPSRCVPSPVITTLGTGAPVTCWAGVYFEMVSVRALLTHRLPSTSKVR